MDPERLSQNLLSQIRLKVLSLTPWSVLNSFSPIGLKLVKQWLLILERMIHNQFIISAILIPLKFFFIITCLRTTNLIRLDFHISWYTILNI